MTKLNSNKFLAAGLFVFVIICIIMGVTSKMLHPYVIAAFSAALAWLIYHTEDEI